MSVGESVATVTLDEKEATSWHEAVRPYVSEVESELIDISHAIHAHPQIRFEETFASQRLAEALEAHGFSVERGVADLPTAFIARCDRADAAEGGPTIAIFCEYDALEGIGHGCGHNVIASAGLGAALSVKRWLDDNPSVPGRLFVLGSPGEEGGGGKVYLIDAGYLEGVDAAMMIHPGGEDRAERRGLARVSLDITFQGRAAHAAAEPYAGVNALDAANLGMVAIGLLRQQIRPDSRIHGIITEGGAAPNIIPERAAIRMYVRSSESEYLRERLLPAVENCMRGAALATGATVEINQPAPAYEDMVTNPVLRDLAERNMHVLGRPVPAASEGDGAMGSTDMGNVSRVVPSVHPHLQLVPDLTMHTHEAAAAAGSAEGDKAVVDGASMLAMTAIELYARPDMMDEVRKSFGNP